MGGMLAARIPPERRRAATPREAVRENVPPISLAPLSWSSRTRVKSVSDPRRTEGDGTTRTSKFTPEQMVHILRQGDSGVPVVELCRSTASASRPTIAGSGALAAEVRELRQLREENRKLKQVVADLTLDKQILKEALHRK
jgi:putative transposase